MPTKPKILYLYAEVMGYNLAVFKSYVKNFEAEVHVVKWDNKKLTPFEIQPIEGVFFYDFSSYNSMEKLWKLVEKVNPDIVFTSGWMEKLYIKTCINIRRKMNIPVVAFCDTHWKGNLKQRLGLVYFKIFYKKAFSNIMVAGNYQFEYAKKLGFKNHEIGHPVYSADLEIFNNIYKKVENLKQSNFPKTFLYAGRFVPQKGLDLLVEAWNGITEKKGWKLILVGEGPLKSTFKENSELEIRDFVQPKDFLNLVQECGCFILPSYKEPWALVLHEFAAAGMPLIASDVCGAATLFVVNDYNGYTFETGVKEDLRKRLQQMIDKSDVELIHMAKRSHEVGQRITPDILAYNSLRFLT